MRGNTISTEQLPEDYLDRFATVGRAIEARGVGQQRVAKIGQAISARLGKPSNHWAQDLDKPKDRHEEAKIEDGIGEWADADSVAAHIAARADYFCSLDFGKSRGDASILDESNRAWLSAEYGIKFVTPADLAKKLKV